MPPTTTSMRAIGALTASFLGLVVAGPALQAAEPAAGLEAVQGLWLDDSGRGAIEITACGDRICGRLVWIKEQGGKPSAKGDVACGQQIIGDVKPVQPGTWDGGWIYSPELHARFDVEVKPIDSGNLQVTGYDGTKDVGQRMVWTRAPAELTRCDATQTGGSQVALAQSAGDESLGPTHKRHDELAPAQAVRAKSTTLRGSTAVVRRPAHLRTKDAQLRRRVHVAARTEHRHAARCNVRAPFANVSFRCSSKASRILARLF